jgi:Nucleotidyl transferase AbiEii toxin, Type IV TA system
VKRPTKETLAGNRYLDLQREAKRTSRPTDELFQLYALECFLDRLVHSEFAKKFVLKGGVLLAALEARRPTRDIDLAAEALDSSVTEVLAVVRKVADIVLDDGLEFDSAGATADAIREEDHYSGVRVSIAGRLSRASVRLHVDVNVGDPIWPRPQQVKYHASSRVSCLSAAIRWRWYLRRKLSPPWREAVLTRAGEISLISMCSRAAIVSALRPCECQWVMWRSIGVWTSRLCGLYSSVTLNSPSNDGSLG